VEKNAGPMGPPTHKLKSVEILAFPPHFWATPPEAFYTPFKASPPGSPINFRGGEILGDPGDTPNLHTTRENQA